MCAGERCRVLSTCVSGLGCGMSPLCGLSEHQPSVPATASEVTAASAFLLADFVLGQRHFIRA
jgi:hypothetical protein